eukprot:scaffold2016_cov131-Isochrysis_galbana.AAC.4
MPSTYRVPAVTRLGRCRFSSPPVKWSSRPARGSTITSRSSSNHANSPPANSGASASSYAQPPACPLAVPADAPAASAMEQCEFR